MRDADNTQPAGSEERFALARMLGTGPDGVSYGGTDTRTGKPVVLHRLKLDAARRQELVERKKLNELAKGDGVLEVVHDGLDAREPTLAVERPGQTLTPQKLERERALQLMVALAETLARAHRVGLFHGALCPSAVFLRDDDAPALDFISPSTGSLGQGPHDDACRAPEAQKDGASDMFALGALLSLTVTGNKPEPYDAAATADSRVRKDDALVLVGELMDVEPAWRPSADEVAQRLRHVLDGTRGGEAEPASPVQEQDPKQLGRFKVDGVLGRGAMGRVYRATDLSDGRAVALKLIDGAFARSVTMLRRFRKEARLLSEVKNPYIANLIDANRDGGVHFIAVELAEGRDLGAVVKEKGGLDEAEVLAIAADLARALVDVHARGIVHRDIKPSNVVLLPDSAKGAPRIKLIDFGIARHVDENASLEMTETGAAVGTPAFMSPEQCRGELLDGKADIYALGCTLYALVCGHPPFSGDNQGSLFAQHMFQPAPALATQKEGVSTPLAALIARCLEKEKDLRPDAAALLEELEELQGRDPTNIAAHPLAPKQDGVTTYRFEWDLKSAPLALWDHVSNTNRLNQAVGLAPVEESFKSVQGDLERFGKNKSTGLSIEWKEHPYEWVHGKRLGVLREFVQGPLYWYRSTVDLKPNGNGGTHLTHTVQLEPRGVLGRVAAAAEIGVRLRLALGRVYVRIDELLRLGPDEATLVADPFDKGIHLDAEQEQRLSAVEKRLVETGADRLATARLGDFLRKTTASDVARIRPLALAQRLNLDPNVLVATCLRATKEGALTFGWDLICPTCRVPSQMKDTLRALKEHGRCEVCNIDYALDLAASVELVFSVHPAIRASDKRTYCLSSPGHTPHVVAQVRIAKGERFELELALDEGRYLLAGRRLPFSVEFRVQKGATAARWEVPLSKGPPPWLSRALPPGAQVLVLENDTDREQLLRVEHAMGRSDALTAAKVASQPLFRKLFPMEVLEPGQLVNVSNVALLMVELVGGAGFEEKSDSGSFKHRYALFRRLEEQTAAEGGAVVKLAGDGVVAVFSDVASAARAGLKLGEDPLPLRAAVHKGPAAAVTLDEHLDYFGKTVRETAVLLARARPRELMLSEAAATDPGVRALSGVQGVGSITLSGGTPAHRIPLQQEA